MSEQSSTGETLDVKEVEVQTLSDEDLDSVAGGGIGGHLNSTAANACCPQTSV